MQFVCGLYNLHVVYTICMWFLQLHSVNTYIGRRMNVFLHVKKSQTCSSHNQQSELLVQCLWLLDVDVE